jgi:hypothetical protein
MGNDNLFVSNRFIKTSDAGVRDMNIKRFLDQAGISCDKLETLEKKGSTEAKANKGLGTQRLYYEEVPNVDDFTPVATDPKGKLSQTICKNLKNNFYKYATGYDGKDRYMKLKDLQLFIKETNGGVTTPKVDDSEHSAVAAQEDEPVFSEDHLSGVKSLLSSAGSIVNTLNEGLTGFGQAAGDQAKVNQELKQAGAVNTEK